MQRFYESIESQLDGQPWYLFCDVSDYVFSQAISEEMAEHVEWKYQHGMRGSAILTNDNIVKAQLNKAVRLKFPQMAFLDKEEALDWLKGL